MVIRKNEVQELLKTLPKGNWDWPGAESVNKKLIMVAEKMARGNAYLNDIHIKTMAVLGSGDEEICKGHLLLCRTYGWLD